MSINVWTSWPLFLLPRGLLGVLFSLSVPSRYVRSQSFWVLDTQNTIVCTCFLIWEDKNRGKKKILAQLFSSEVVKSPTAADFNILEKCFLLSSLESTLLFSYYAEQNLGQNREKHQLLIRHKLFLIYTQCLIPGSQKCKLCFKNNMLTSHLSAKDRSPIST